MPKRLVKATVMLNGEDISEHVSLIDANFTAGAIQTATMRMYLNDITKNEDGSIVFWVGDKEEVITIEVPVHMDKCPKKGCRMKQPHEHVTKEEGEWA